MTDEPLTNRHYENIQGWVAKMLVRMDRLECQLLLMQHLIAQQHEAGIRYHQLLLKQFDSGKPISQELLKEFERLLP